jgi:hypothetical protein
MHPQRNLTAKLATRFRGNVRPLALAALGVAALTSPALAPAPAQAEVREFPQEVRHLHGWLANEHVPAYRCPWFYPLLEKRRYAPDGTALPHGVSVKEERETWPIGVSITAVKTSGGSEYPWAMGTETGFPHSSATSWVGGDQWYQVVLHCTNDKEEGYRVKL